MGVHREGVPRLLDVRHQRPGAAPHRRRPEARAAAHRLRDVGAGPLGGGEVRQVGAHGRRCARQVPSPRRQRLLRGDGADGPAVLVPLSAHRGTGQLGRARRPEVLRGHALHGVPAVAVRRAAALRSRPGHGRLRAELRRHHRRAGTPAGAVTAGPAERQHRHRGRHGHRCPPAQPARGRERVHPAARRAAGRYARPHGPRAGPRLPDRGDHRHVPGGTPRNVRDRPRLGARAGAARRRERGDRHYGAALPGVAGAGARAGRRADAGEEAPHARRPARRVGPRDAHAARPRAAFEPGGRGTADEPPLRVHGPRAELPGQLQRDRPGPEAEGPGPRGDALRVAGVPPRDSPATADLPARTHRRPVASPRRTPRRVPQTSTR